MPMTAALQRRRDYAGPALLADGLRPFFLAAGVWGALTILFWLPLSMGTMTVDSVFSPADWQIHEMLYGYAVAAMAGFLLTAIPNRTGRLPVSGWPLGVLALLWFCGRVAMLASGKIGGLAAAAIDVGFLATLAAVVAREIITGKHSRSLPALAMLGLLIVGNVVFHAEVLLYGRADYGIRIALGTVVMSIVLVGGGAVPGFTNIWRTRENPGRMRVSFSDFDAVALAVTVLALIAWIAVPAQTLTGALMIVAGLSQAVRLARWAGDRTLADPLSLVLHAGYAFVPLGFLLIGASTWFSAVPASAGIDAWTSGAIGLTMLAVMTRETLGHTGQPLQAGAATLMIYICVLAAALLFIVAAISGSTILLEYAGMAWIAGFACFVLLYGSLLATHRPAWAETIAARCAENR
jgi:uncharacterized protein involved in response to NO